MPSRPDYKKLLNPDETQDAIDISREGEILFKIIQARGLRKDLVLPLLIGMLRVAYDSAGMDMPFENYLVQYAIKSTQMTAELNGT